MIQYKLIKEYPGSLIIHSIVTKTSVEGLPQVYECQSTKKLIPVVDVELNPYYWQKVEERSYKVTAYQNPGNNNVYPRDKNGNYLNTVGGPMDAKMCSERYNIYSIERQSDGEIFTIGDRVVEGIIKRFRIPHLTLCQYSCQDKDNWIDLTCAKKESPLIITEDKIPIYKNDRCYIVDKNWEIINSNIHTFGLSTDVKYFAKEVEAKEYINLYRPRYSRENVIKALDLAQIKSNDKATILYFLKSN